MTMPDGNFKSYPFERLRNLGVSELTARKLSVSMTISSFQIGEVIFKRGSHIPSWNFIISGIVAETVPVGDKKSTPIGLYGQRSWFGEQSIINSQPSSAQYLSLTDVDMISLDANAVHNLLSTEHEFAIHITKLMAWRIQKRQEMLVLMKLGNPCLRVVAGICQFAETLAYGDRRPQAISNSVPLEIPAPQGYVAALCGVSRGSLSVTIQHLAEHGCLRISYGKLELLQPDIWFDFAELQRNRHVDCMNPTIGDLIQDFKFIQVRQARLQGSLVTA